MDRSDAIKLLDLYIYDYFIKHSLFQSADAFAQEVGLTVTPIAVNPPGGFLCEWFSLFWDIFCGYNTKENALNNNHAPDGAGPSGTPPENLNPSVPVQDGDVMLPAVGASMDVPGPSNLPKPYGLTNMPLPDMANVWQNMSALSSGIGFDPYMLGAAAFPGFNMMPDQTVMCDFAAAAFQMEELLGFPFGNLYPGIYFDQNAPMMDPSSSIGHPPKIANNNWLLSAPMDGNVGASWMASTSAELPPLVPQGMSWMAAISAEMPPLAPQPTPPTPQLAPPPQLSHLAPQPLPKNPEAEETGSSASSNSPPSNAGY